MSDVKSRVIRIVNGLPPIEPKVLVELGSGEKVLTVNQVRELSRIADLSALDDLVAHDPEYKPDTPVLSSLLRNVAFKAYLKGEITSERYNDIVGTTKTEDGGYCGFGPEFKELVDKVTEFVEEHKAEHPEPNPDPTGDSTPIPVSSKPYIRFKMMRSSNYLTLEDDNDLAMWININGLGFPKVVLS